MRRRWWEHNRNRDRLAPELPSGIQGIGNASSFILRGLQL